MGFIRIRKDTAENLINCGYTIGIIPCKARIGNAWVAPFLIDEDYLKRNHYSFEHFMNIYEIENCKAELGTYAHYFLYMAFSKENYVDKCYPYYEAMQIYKKHKPE